MKQDAELDLWRSQWQAAPDAPVLSGLRERVARESRSLRILLLADLLVTVVIGGAVIFVAVRDPRAETVLLAAATWLFIAVAWTFGLSNRKNSWSPAASTTSAFLDLSLRRCRASLRAVNFAAILYICQMAFCLSWVYHDLSRRSPLSLSAFVMSTPIMVVWLCTLFVAAGLIWYRRKKLSDLAYLLNLQQELVG